MIRLIAMRPVTAYVLLAFAFSYTVGTVTLWMSKAWLHSLPAPLPTLAGVLGVVYGPAFAALVVTYKTAGREGVSRLLGQLKLNPRDLGWLVTLPAASLGMAVLASALAGVAPSATWIALAASGRVLAVHYALGVFVYLGEELGWRGWLLPTLLGRYAPIKATLVVAAIWWVWHLPKLLAGPRIALGLAVTCLGLSLLFTALSLHIGPRVLVFAAAHAAANAPWSYLEKAAGLDAALTAWTWAGVLYIGAACVIVTVRRRGWFSPPIDPGRTAAGA